MEDDAENVDGIEISAGFEPGNSLFKGECVGFGKVFVNL